MLTGHLAAALTKGPYALDVRLPTDDEGNYTGVIVATGQVSGTKVTFTITATSEVPDADAG
jgi:hypothetical protein